LSHLVSARRRGNPAKVIIFVLETIHMASAGTYEYFDDGVGADSDLSVFSVSPLCPETYWINYFSFLQCPIL
jgi:hypothetical protein